MSGKKTKGKQKIEMKLIENEDTKITTFSKRRSGISKKASELVTLTGADIAVVAFSPAGKPYAFGSPSVAAVTNRFLGVETPRPRDKTAPIVEAHRQARINRLNLQQTHLLQRLEEEQKKCKIMAQKMEGVDTKGWWDAKVENLHKSELVELESKFKDLLVNLKANLQEKKRNGTATTPAQAPPADQNPPADMEPPAHDMKPPADKNPPAVQKPPADVQNPPADQNPEKPDA